MRGAKRVGWYRRTDEGRNGEMDNMEILRGIGKSGTFIGRKGVMDLGEWMLLLDTTYLLGWRFAKVKDGGRILLQYIFLHVL